MGATFCRCVHDVSRPHCGDQRFGNQRTHRHGICHLERFADTHFWPMLTQNPATAAVHALICLLDRVATRIAFVRVLQHPTCAGAPGLTVLMDPVNHWVISLPFGKLPAIWIEFLRLSCSYAMTFTNAPNCICTSIALSVCAMARLRF